MGAEDAGCRAPDWRRRMWGLIALTIAAGQASAADALVTIEAGSEPTRIAVVATIPEAQSRLITEGGLAQETGERWLRLGLKPADSKGDGEAMLGDYVRKGSQLRFTPRYALVAGQRYAAVVDWGMGRVGRIEYQVPPAPPSQITRVTAVYPSANELPANQLKFYLHFSQPMRQTREIFSHVELLDQHGRLVEDPWRRTELWSEDGKRLTLLIHPGRIKQGIQLGVLLGPVLKPDEVYTLIVHRTMLDASGRELGEAFTKKFRTRAAERTLPLTKDWRVTVPPAGTGQPLQIIFPRPMDRALLDRMVSVKDDRGELVSGRIEVRSDETIWILHPHRPWRDSQYIVAVDPRLEDLAGNSPVRLFDAQFSAAEVPTEDLEIAFRPTAR